MKLNIDGLYVQSGTISTFTDKYIDTRNPDPDTICIEDIAHQLSQQPRFGGKLKRVYTVAQHCIECALLVPMEHALGALLHDASEAYICDLPSPIKSELPGYKVIEDRLMYVIANKFGFKYPLSSEIKAADKYMLELEWSCIVKGVGLIRYMSHEKAEQIFLNLYYALK